MKHKSQNITNSKSKYRNVNVIFPEIQNQLSEAVIERCFPKRDTFPTIFTICNAIGSQILR